MPFSTGRYDLLRARLGRFMRASRGIGEGNVRAIHRTRVASRRLRELLPVLQLDSDTSDKLSKKLRKVTRALGPVRELDVQLLLIDELLKGGRHDAQALATVRDHVLRDREGIRTVKATAVDLRRVAHRLERAAEELRHADESAAARAWRWALDARVARRALALKRAIDDAGAVYIPERLHAVRITLKKLRYAVELSAEAGGPIDAADLRALRRWQELLGHLHDVQVLLDRVRQVEGSQTPIDVATRGEFDTLIAALEASCRPLHARYVRQRDAVVALCERLDARTSLPSGAAARRAS